MGYAGFSREEFFAGLSLQRRGAGTARLALGRAWFAHGLKLTVVSAFLQAIVIRRPPLEFHYA